MGLSCSQYQLTLIKVFELQGSAAIGIFQHVDGDYIVIDFSTEKALLCLGQEQANWVYSGCIDSLKRVIGIGSETNEFN